MYFVQPARRDVEHEAANVVVHEIGMGLDPRDAFTHVRLDVRDGWNVDKTDFFRAQELLLDHERSQRGFDRRWSI